MTTTNAALPKTPRPSLGTPFFNWRMIRYSPWLFAIHSVFAILYFLFQILRG